MKDSNKRRRLKVTRFSKLTVALAAGLFANYGIAKGNDHELLVTASKQSQYAASSQNVASYSVTSDELEQANVTNSRQLGKVLPGINIFKSESFLYPMSSIRGAMSLDFYNSALTIYVDGVPQPSIAMAQALGDVKQVEVLKGPQSTLYGKAAEGGVVDIITEQPSVDYSGYISGGYSSRNGYRGKVNVSGPIADGILYGSITGLREVDSGRLTNPGSGHRHLNGEEDNLGAFRLRLAPDNQPWEINAAYTAQCEDSSQALYVNYKELNGSDSLYIPGMPDPHFHRCIRNQSLRGQYDAGHWLFTAVSSWQQINFTSASPNPPMPGANDNSVHVTREKWLVDVQELRAATQGKGNKMDGVFGLYRENIRQNRNNLYPSAMYGDSTASGGNNRSTLSAYTDLTWHTTQQLDFGAGLRFSHEKSSVIYNSFNPYAGASHIVDSTLKNHVLGQLSAGYQLTDANRLYARIAQGYQAGGFGYALSSSAYQPQKNITYEIGSKYNGDRFHLQGAVYYSKTKDYQMYLGEVSRQTLQNAGDARAYGLELNGDYIFIPGWKLAANINLTNSKFSDDAKNTAQFAGKRVPLVPVYSGGVYLTGNINTAIGTFSPYVRVNVIGDYDYKDTDKAKQPAYSTTDIRLAWQATNRITLSAYVDNIFDKRYASYAFDFPGSTIIYASVNNGRTAGVDVKIDLF